jgi:hypothetical protein
VTKKGYRKGAKTQSDIHLDGSACIGFARNVCYVAILVFSAYLCGLCVNDLHAIFNAEHTEIGRGHREVIGEVKEELCRLFGQSRLMPHLLLFMLFNDSQWRREEIKLLAQAILQVAFVGKMQSRLAA